MPATEQRVRQAIEQIGYVPDAVARSLRARRTNQLAFAVADVGNPSYVAMMRAVESVVRGAGYRLVIHSTGADPNEELAVVSGLARGYVDGLILSPLHVTVDLLRSLTTTPAPVVVVGNLPEGALVDNVRTDSGSGIRLAIEHLAATGRSQIAMVNGPPDTEPGSIRRRAFLGALTATGSGLDGKMIEDATEFTAAAGLAAARNLLARVRPHAVICANDLIALGVMRFLAEQALRVPDDVAVVGMDDTELAELSLPSLTSVSLEAAARGSLAARFLLERLADPDLPPRHELVPPRLVVRESSGPPKSVAPRRR